MRRYLISLPVPLPPTLHIFTFTSTSHLPFSSAALCLSPPTAVAHVPNGKPSDCTMPFFTTNDEVDLFYLDEGARDGPPLILVRLTLTLTSFFPLFFLFPTAPAGRIHEASIKIPPDHVIDSLPPHGQFRFTAGQALLQPGNGTSPACHRPTGS
jgi:hypothetical protein